MPKLKTICILYPISFFPHIPQRHPLSWHFCVSLSAICFLLVLHTHHTYKKHVVYIPLKCSSIVNYYTYFVQFDWTLTIFFRLICVAESQDSQFTFSLRWLLILSQILTFKCYIYSDNSQIYISISNTSLNPMLICTIVYLTSPFECATNSNFNFEF